MKASTYFSSLFWVKFLNEICLLIANSQLLSNNSIKLGIKKVVKKYDDENYQDGQEMSRILFEH